MYVSDILAIGMMKSFPGSVILYPVGLTVQLGNGGRARVVENNAEYVLRPKIVALRQEKCTTWRRILDAPV